ncbi:hypothetical protein BH09ACT1_BH09ACT1_14960 [soil metagenome]
MNTARILLTVAVVLALALAVWFVVVVFVLPYHVETLGTTVISTVL